MNVWPKDLYLRLNKINMFTIDFEIGIHEAVRSIWPTSITRGCNFHLGQAWLRKLQNLGLSKVYIEGDTDEGKFLNYIFGLPFVCFWFNCSYAI